MARLIDPATIFLTITPSDTAPISGGASRGIYVGGAGDLVVGTPGAPVTLKAVPTGSILPIQTNFVMATGTTATNIVALR